MKRSSIFLAVMLAAALIGTWFLIAKKNDPGKTAEQSARTEASAIGVVVKKAHDLKAAVTEERLPAIIVPQSETVIAAKTSGTVSLASFEIGKPVALGSILAHIENITDTIASKSGLQSESVRQAEIAVSLAKKSYKDAKRLAEGEKTKSVANKLARDLAKLRLESAEINLSNALDSSVVRSPISGVVSEKSIGVGSSVAIGTPIARIVSTSPPKVRFQVSSSAARALKTGDAVSIRLSDGNEETATISSMSAIADASTGKFPVEALFKKATSAQSGTVATARIQITGSASETALLLPLSAITTGQDGSFFFIVENGVAKKIPIASIAVSGETGTIPTNISNDADVITESMGALEDGTAITTAR